MKQLLFALLILANVLTQAQTMVVDEFVFGGQEIGDYLAYYRFSNSAEDDADNNHDLTLVGNAGYGTDKESDSNSALALDGSGDYAYAADSDQLSFGDASSDSPFSICAWVYYEGTGGGANPSAPIVTKYVQYTVWEGEYAFVITNSDKLSFQTLDGATNIRCRQDSDAIIPKNTWKHVVATYDGSGADEGIKLYVDGSLIASTGFGQDGSYVAMHNTDSELLIGAQLIEGNTTYRGFFDGKIDDVRIYGKELSASEVTAIFNQGV